jgi:hypothetical protein
LFHRPGKIHAEIDIKHGWERERQFWWANLLRVTSQKTEKEIKGYYQMDSIETVYDSVNSTDTA